MIEKLTENQYKILKELNEEWYSNYKHLEQGTRLPLDVLKKEVKILKESSLIKYARGLINNNGMVTGSGFSASREKWDLIEKYVKELEDVKTN